jgi:sporulation protein YlmC with PRC-barrel domain
MLWKIKDLYGYRIDAINGEIGKVENFLFDDTTWKIRYMVVETGSWLLARKVLIPPAALCLPNAQMSIFPVNLTKDQVSNSPDIDTDKHVSLQHQIKLDMYYQSFPFMPTSMLPGSAVMPAMAEMPKESTAEKNRRYDQHLRSARHVAGYHVHSLDGQFGNVKDFIADDDGWVIHYLVIDTINWLPSKWVLIPVSQVTKISWEEKGVYIGLNSEIIKNAPPYQSSTAIDRQYEHELNRYYGK